MQHPISIVSISSISPLGFEDHTILENYKSKTPLFSEKEGNLVSQLSDKAKHEIDTLRQSHSKYADLDDTVLFGIYVARRAVKKAGWTASDGFGINIGSSRGATQLFETHFENFLKSDKAHILSSPTTTLGNISSWIAHDLQTQGPDISHSITCSTALHAMINGIAWINSGLTDKFLVGGSEAPLTPFTIAQMQALKIYARSNADYPCKALDLNKTENTMILSEGAAVACLEKGSTNDAIANIIGFGYGTEVLTHSVSLSTDAECFQRSMRMAIANHSLEDVDIIITHTPGTIKGDLAEYNAIKNVFCNKIPFLTTNKWKVGHSLGASGVLSIEMAILMLQHQEILSVPFMEQPLPKKISKILINAVGFGGNAVSILLSK
ncbi:MAG: beta-ketoacyl synthase N-terminal-like domain-containing protein [Bacteroidota bacterium]